MTEPTSLQQTFTDEQREQYPNYYRFCGASDDEKLLADWLCNESDIEMSEWVHTHGDSAAPELVPTYMTPDRMLCRYYGIPFGLMMMERNAMIEEMLTELREITNAEGD